MVLVVNCSAVVLPARASADEITNTGTTVAVTVSSDAVFETGRTVVETA